MVVGGEVGFVLLREAGDPGDAVGMWGVEVGGAWDGDVGEQVCVPLGGNGWGLGDGVFGEVVDDAVLNVDVAVGRGGGDGEEEGAVGVVECGVEEAEGFADEDVGGVVALVAFGRGCAALEGGVEVFVGIWIEQEVGASPAFGEWVVVVGDGVRVEELSGVVGAVAGVL